MMSRNLIRKKLKRLWGCIKIATFATGNPYQVILEYYIQERKRHDRNKLPRFVADNGIMATPKPSGGVSNALHWYRLGWC